jgi:hypothetical protein
MELAQSIRSVKQAQSDSQSSFVVPQAFGSTSHPTVTGEVDEDTTGCGKFPCVQCARFFVDSRSLTEHQRGKVHKRRSAFFFLFKKYLQERSGKINNQSLQVLRLALIRFMLETDAYYGY